MIDLWCGVHVLLGELPHQDFDHDLDHGSRGIPEDLGQETGNVTEVEHGETNLHHLVVTIGIGGTVIISTDYYKLRLFWLSDRSV